MEWSLSGPSEFIRKSIDKLEDRKNIIFMLTEDFDTYLLRQTLRKVIIERELDLLWQEWSVSDLINDYHIQPGEALTRAFGLQDDDPAAIHDAGFVAQSNNFSDLVIYLEGLDELAELDRQRWMRFLADYAHACRERQDRSLFCVPLIGMVAFENPPEDVLLEHQWWWGIVSRWDVMQYLNLVSPVISLENTWKNAIISELAGWDLDLVDKLIQLEDLSFDNTFSCLIGYANEKEWNNIDLKNLNQITLIDTQGHKPPVSVQDLWAKGILNLIPGDGYNIHPAMLVAARKQKDLKRLLRKGQSRSILLTIDDQRLAVCEYLSAKYGNEWCNWCDGKYNGNIGEIGHLHYLFTHENQLIKSESAHNIRDLVSWMNKTRNRLSHLRHLDLQDIRTGVRLIAQARSYLRNI